MGLFKKKNDPISDKARALESEIEKLEAEIRKLSEAAGQPQPKFRSSAVPGGRSAPLPQIPLVVVDEVDQTRLKAPDTTPPGEHYNELGVRKYDLVAAWRRLKNNFRGPSASNPKLVNYLAAGSIQGLRPLRYEKRVARNRFIFLVVVLLLLLWGIIAVFVRR
jgi:hypothetical protein